ncbi:MAG: S1 RNA-binding domain-containing protein [Balneolaceae bacterium]
MSNMAENKKIEDPHDVISVGDIISVEILTLDLERGRIGLKLVKGK